MPRRYAFGMAEEATHPDSVKATLSEFLSTFIFVFAGEGSVLALGNYNYNCTSFFCSSSCMSCHQSINITYCR